MSFGMNLQYLRKAHGSMTQEKLAEKMEVSRQTVSKWEMDEAYPEVEKLLALCDVFSCSLDALLRGDMAAKSDIYSPVRVETVKGFRMARYVIVSPNPEDDVNTYMNAWARKSGLMDIPGVEPRLIGWDFPFISQEQQNRFGLRGYVAAYVLPEGFSPRCGGAEIASQPDAQYAVVSVREPFVAPFTRIPGAYKVILEALNAKGFRENVKENLISCFEWVYKKDGVEYMNVYVHVDAVGKANLHTSV